MDVLFTILTGFFRFVWLILVDLYGWVPIVGIIGYFGWQNYRRAKWVDDSEHVLLLLEVPRTNDKKELSAEQMFAALHGILRPKSEIRKEGSIQEHVSFEIASINSKIQFYIHCPKHLQNFIEGQVYAQYPTVQIRKVEEDYTNRDLSQKHTCSTELILNKQEVLPIKTFPSFEVDPLAGITATLAKLDDEDEEMWIQILARPVDDNWHKKGIKFINTIRSGGKISLGSATDSFFSFIIQALSALAKPPEDAKKGSGQYQPSEREKSMISATEEKIKKLGYEVKVRIVYNGNDKHTARLRMQAMIGTFKQFNTTNLNGFSSTSLKFNKEGMTHYRARLFLDRGYILNIEELASLYHLPHTSVETPSIIWANTKTAEPPSNLPSVEESSPEAISPIGVTNFRGHQMKFGLSRADRGRHLYVIGQTGVGKSKLLQLLALSDLYHNHGFAIVDPHGDFATETMEFVHPDRLDDVIYFNAADTDFPVAFNPLEVTDPTLKNHISSEIVGVLKRMFDSWGPRLEYILRYTILALLDYPNSTMLGITRMLTEKEYRKRVIDQIQDPVVKNFWVNEFGSWNNKFAAEAVSPVLNKVGAFTANPLIRNIVGQPKSSIDIRRAMDEGKILIINLSRGLVGEDNAAILGALMVTKIQLAAMSRADMPMEERRPFYLYVDEFQNFATDSFAVILSEARKYGLNLTVANQYISQMSPMVRDAVFGNVGSMISFRVGPEDAGFLVKYFQPAFEADDLVGLHNQNFVATLSIGGEKANPFSAITLTMPEANNSHLDQIITMSRSKYASSKEEVENKIRQWTSPLSHSQKQKSKQKPKETKSEHSSDNKSPNDGIKPDKTVSLR